MAAALIAVVAIIVVSGWRGSRTVGVSGVGIGTASKLVHGRGRFLTRKVVLVERGSRTVRVTGRLGRETRRQRRESRHLVAVAVVVVLLY